MDEIHLLSEVEAVRKNPWMYIGSVGPEGAAQLLREVVHNSLDEALLGHCTQIRVTVGERDYEVQDNGRGIPTEMHSIAGIPSCEVALTRLHSGSKFEREEARFTAGLHGVGLSCVNALSSRLELTVDRKGRRFEQSYERGKPLAPLRELGASDSHGTTVRFTPDPEIFRGFHGINAASYRAELEDLAFLNPGLEIRFHDTRTGDKAVFRSGNPGLTALLRKHSPDARVLLAEPIRLSCEEDELVFEALLFWTAGTEVKFVSFVNSVWTTHGGTHVNAFRSGVVQAVNRMIAEAGGASWKGVRAEVEEVCEGLAAVVSCKSARPNFEGQIKTRFTNQEVVRPIERASSEQMYRYLNENPKVASIVLDRITDARNARLAARRVADRIYLEHGPREINEAIYKEQFGARSKNWHDSAVWITHDSLLKTHAELCKVNKESIALDVCCGSGVVGASFKGKVKKVVGLDLTPEMVNLARQRLDEVTQGTVYNIPFPDNTFDLVCTREVLHLLPYPEKPVSEIFRVLKPGGQFIVGQILPFSEDDAAWMYRVFKKKQPLVFNMFQEDDFRRLLLSPGFTQLEMKELHVWESIDTWIDSYETTAVHRHEIRDLFRNAPAEAKAAHPFEINANGEIRDLWRWCIFSVRKPGARHLVR